MTQWNEGRLDDLSDRVDRIEKKMETGFVQTYQRMDTGFARLDKKMDDGFARMDKKIDEGFVRVDATFARVDARLDALNGTLTRSMWTFGVGMLTFAGTLLGLFATKF